MVVPIDVKDCLVILESLQTLEEQFSQTSHFCFKRLCERTEIFLPALKSLEVETAFSSKNEAELVGLKRSFTSLKQLLSDIQDVVSKDHKENSFSVRNMVVNEDFRSNMAEAIFNFHARIHEFQSELLPTVAVSVEKTRAEDLEDFQLDMEAMLAAVMEEICGLRMNPAEQKRCLQAMKQDCSEGQTEILNKLSEVEAMVDANHDVSLMDLAGIEQAINSDIFAFMASLKSKITG
jgi:hypothetical protein